MDLYEFLGKFKNLPDGVEKRLHHHFVHSSIEVAKQWKSWCNERVGKYTRKTCTYDEAIFLADTFAEEIASSTNGPPGLTKRETAWAALENSVNSYGYHVRHFHSVAEMSELCAFWPDAESVWVSGGNRPDHVHCTWADPARLKSNFGFVFFKTGTELNEATSVAAMRFAADHHDRRSDGDYGRSVMMYQVAKKGSYRSLKSRWNHAANGGPHCDHIFDDDLNVAIGEGVQLLMDSFLNTLDRENSFTPLLRKTPGAKGKFIRLNPGYKWGPDGTLNRPINPDKEIVVNGEILYSGLQPKPEDSKTITAFGFREIRRVFLNNPKAVIGKPDCIVVLPEGMLAPDFNGNAIEINANGFITGIWLPFATEIEDMFHLDVGTNNLRNLHIGSARVIRNSFYNMYPYFNIQFDFTNVESIKCSNETAHLFMYYFGTQTFPMVQEREPFSCAAHAWANMDEQDRRFYALKRRSIVATSRWNVYAEDYKGKQLLYVSSMDLVSLKDLLRQQFFSDGTNPDPWGNHCDGDMYDAIIENLYGPSHSVSASLENGIRIRIIREGDTRRPVILRAIRKIVPGASPYLVGELHDGRVYDVRIGLPLKIHSSVLQYTWRSNDLEKNQRNELHYKRLLNEAKEDIKSLEALFTNAFYDYLRKQCESNLQSVTSIKYVSDCSMADYRRSVIHLVAEQPGIYTPKSLVFGGFAFYPS